MSTGASSSSTRDRILQGRWRQDLEEGHNQDYSGQEFRHDGSRSRNRRYRQKSGWAWQSSARSASPSIRDRDRFSDNSSVSTIRNYPHHSHAYQDSEPETYRSYDTRSISSISSVSHWSATGQMPSGPAVSGYRESPLARARSFQTIRPESPEFDDSRKSHKTRDNFNFKDTRDDFNHQTKENFKFEEYRDDFKFKEGRDDDNGRSERASLRRENSNLDDFKSLSAQDFEKNLMMEQRLAMDEEDKNAYHNDQDISSVDSFNEVDSNFNKYDSTTEKREFNSDQHLLRTGMEQIEKNEKLSPTGIKPDSSISSFSVDVKSKPFAARQFTINGSNNQEQLSQEVDDELMKLLRNSQAQNTRLKLELKALESLLESAKFQLASTKDQVTEDNIDYEKDKEEDAEVAKKLTEIEEELKILSFSENLTDQALGQLKIDNEKLRDERSSLLQVLYKLSRVI